MRKTLVAIASIGIAFLPLVIAQEAAKPMAAWMRRFVEDKTVAGAVCLVAQGGRVIHLDALGQADLAGRRPMRDDTLFWIASMTKPITATAVMILQDDGKLSVDDLVAKHLPEFAKLTVAGGGPPQRAITIRDLLTHTSGVANPDSAELGLNPTLAEITKSIARQPLQFEPGSQWKYGSGLTVVGRIVEVVSEQPFDRFLDDRLFRPLGMKDTTFYPSAEQRQRLAKIYRWDRDQRDLVAASLSQNSETVPERQAPGPSGGLCSTAQDYFRFLQMVLNKGQWEGQRIVSAKAIEQMTSLATGNVPTGSWPGLGWTLGWGIVQQPMGLTEPLSRGSFGHGGAFGTLGWIDPERQAVLVLMIARSDLSSAKEAEIRGSFFAAEIEQCSRKTSP